MKIAIFQIRPGIGDMCLFKPYIEVIHKKYNSKLFLFTKKRSSAKILFQYSSSIEKIFYIDEFLKLKNLFKFIKFLKDMNFDKAFIFSYSKKISLILSLAKINNILKYNKSHMNLGISKEAEIFLRDKLEQKNIDINCSLETRDNILPETKDQFVIGIGGSGPDKKWPVNFYIELIKKISEIKNYTFVIAGGHKEKKDFELIKKELSNLELLSLCEFEIDKCIEIIEGSKLYVGNDTGFMHISGLLGINTIGLFGDTSLEYAAYNKKIITISPDETLKSESNDFLIKKLSVSKVYDEVINYI